MEAYTSTLGLFIFNHIFIYYLCISLNGEKPGMGDLEEEKNLVV